MVHWSQQEAQAQASARLHHRRQQPGRRRKVGSQREAGLRLHGGCREAHGGGAAVGDHYLQRHPLPTRLPGARGHPATTAIFKQRRK